MPLSLIALVSATWLSVAASHVRADEPTLLDGFRDELVWGGFTRPTALAIAGDGTVFVAEKSGRIKVFSSLTDDTPTLFADLTTNVHNAWDRGLLGLAVDPDYPARPYVYALYTYDHILGDSAPAPRWGTAGAENDSCPNPPGFTADGCVASGRLTRLTAQNGVMVGSEHVLVEGWCQQFPSHSVGAVAFGPDGALYASGGEGASFALTADYGQYGGTLPTGGPYVTPRNPCGDPPGGVGGAMTIPTAEGGSLRSQDIRTRGPGDPVGLSGTVIRVDPDTGAGWPSNANTGDSDANARRIIAYGMRNPFRFTFDPNGRVYIGDVGSTEWEEIDVVSDPDAAPRNFGWPCREGAAPGGAFAPVGLNLCESLAASSTTDPYIKWSHRAEVVNGDGCGGATGFTSSSISGLTFLPSNSPFPAPYDGALFATDYTRPCIWAYPLGSNGRPDPAQGHLFADLHRVSEESGGAIQLVTSPTGDLLYVDYDRQEVHRIRWYGPSQPPVASFVADPPYGPLPLTVDFDASATTDPNPEPLTYEWDLDGDGAYDDGTGVTISKTYTSAGRVDVGLRVTDTEGLFNEVTQRVDPGNSPPSVTMSAPAAGTTWRVGDSISFAATGSDAQDGTLGDAAFSWSFEMLHCPGGDCHSHVIQELTATKTGSFIAPDHEYPSHLRLTVTVTDSGGMTSSVSRELDPETGTLSLASSPTGIPLRIGETSGSPPPPLTAIVNSKVGVAAPDEAFIGEDRYVFDHWSDGGAQAHDVTIPAGSSTLTATFAHAGSADIADTCSAAPTGSSPTGSWTSARLGKANDVDWYRFTLASSGRVRIVLGDLPITARVELYRGCSTLITGVDRPGTAPEELHRQLSAGSYAVRVIGKSGSSSLPYALMIRKLPNSVTTLSTRTRIEGSTIRFVGEVYNNTTQTRHVDVTARLYNGSGTLLATRTAATLVSKLGPNERAPYLISGSLPTGYVKATIQVSSSISSTTLTRPAVTVTSSGPNAQNQWEVGGTARNTSSRRADTLRIGVILYDPRANTLDAIRATTGATTLNAGASTSFVATALPVGLAPILVSVRALAYLH
jgi:PKD repeat protein/glucose/arabinose dehydrogenase